MTARTRSATPASAGSPETTIDPCQQAAAAFFEQSSSGQQQSKYMLYPYKYQFGISSVGVILLAKALGLSTSSSLSNLKSIHHYLN